MYFITRAIYQKKEKAEDCVDTVFALAVLAICTIDIFRREAIRDNGLI